MARMNVELNTTAKLTAAELRTMNQWLSLAAPVIEQLKREGAFDRLPEKQFFHVSLLVCGDVRIRDLNRDHRNKDKITDVLSFPAGELSTLGDLAICMPQTKRQAKRFDIKVMDEFIHLFFHGVLHLSGFDHEISVEEEELQQKWEDRALELFSKARKKKKLT
jgi:probable rRNA maturation factor